MCAIVIALMLALASAAAQEELPTIGALIADDQNFSLLAELLDEFPDLRDRLDNPVLQFTVFAPTDAAFEAMREVTGIKLDDLRDDPARLRALIQYHIVPLAINPDFFQVEGYVEYGTLLPETTVQPGGGFIPNAVSPTPIGEVSAAANGWLVMIPRALLPPQWSVSMGGPLWPVTPDNLPEATPEPDRDADASLPSVIEALEETGDFDLFLELVGSDPEYALLLEESGPYTLFLPDDAAWYASFEAMYLTVEERLLEDPMNAGVYLRYLTAPGYFSPETLAARVADGRVFSPGTLFNGFGLSLYAEVEELIINYTSITAEPILAHNAIIYPIAAVLFAG
jgi:uncharacterized surface protein with fasciclin (FAS1) repeats